LCTPVQAQDPIEHAQTLHDLGNALLDAGTSMKDADRVHAAEAKLEAALDEYSAALRHGPASTGLKSRIQRQHSQCERDLAFARKWLAMQKMTPGRAPSGRTPAPDHRAPSAGGPVAPPGPAPTSNAGETPSTAAPEVHAEPPRPGERLGLWCRHVLEQYGQTPSPAGRAALARQMARDAGRIALPSLKRLFETEANGTARRGIHESLADIGGVPVSGLMRSYGFPAKERYWQYALDVIYRCLEKPEAEEPERPFLKTIRQFHKLRRRSLTLAILTHLDEMGSEGVGALGQVLYVPDIGYHDHAIQLLAKKRDGRAVAPLVYKMNRFKFDYRVQMPAHKALLEIGWYAVPELINHLDNHAAGIWISWTLRKITGETMGTDKRKWSYWWTRERVRHPELFENPDERPASVTPGGRTPRR